MSGRRFPLKRFQRLGYEHVALNGQKGYHGVVVVSRLPFETHRQRSSAARPTAGTSRWCSASAPACAIRSRCTISMCRPAATSPTRRSIRSSPTSSRSSTRCATARSCAATVRPRDPGRRSQRGAARARRVEPQADAGSSRIPRSNARSSPPPQKSAAGSTSCGARAGAGEALYLVELSRPRLGGGRQGPQARPHLDVAPALADRRRPHDFRGSIAVGAAVRSVPVTATVGWGRSWLAPAVEGRSTHRSRAWRVGRGAISRAAGAASG